MFYAKTDATLVKLLTAAMFTDGVISQNCTLLLRGSQFAIYVAYPKTEVTVVVRGQYTTVESGHSCLSWTFDTGLHYADVSYCGRYWVRIWALPDSRLG